MAAKKRQRRAWNLKARIFGYGDFKPGDFIELGVAYGFYSKGIYRFEGSAFGYASLFSGSAVLGCPVNFLRNFKKVTRHIGMEELYVRGIQHLLHLENIAQNGKFSENMDDDILSGNVLLPSVDNLSNSGDRELRN